MCSELRGYSAGVERLVAQQIIQRVKNALPEEEVIGWACRMHFWMHFLGGGGVSVHADLERMYLLFLEFTERLPTT